MNQEQDSELDPLQQPGAAPREIDVGAADAIDAALGDLVAEARLDFAAVLDDSGTVLGWAGGENAAPLEMLVESSGALAMGTFAAAQALAMQLGGDDSRELLHHAGSRSFHLTEIGSGSVLFSVWTEELAPGFLRDRSTRAARRLAEVLDEAPAARPPARSVEMVQPLAEGAVAGFPSVPPARDTMPGRYVFEIG